MGRFYLDDLSAQCVEFIGQCCDLCGQRLSCHLGGASFAAADTGRSATTPTELVGMAELAQLSKPSFFNNFDLHPCDLTKLAFAVVDRKQALSHKGNRGRSLEPVTIPSRSTTAQRAGGGPEGTEAPQARGKQVRSAVVQAHKHR